MNTTSKTRLRRVRGSAFITVMLFTFILFMLVGSIITWSLNERRLNMRHAYWLEARNAAEAVAEYGFSQIVTRFDSYASPPSLNPAGSTPLTLPSASFFSGGNVTTSAYSSSNPKGLELIGGTYATVPSTGALYYIDPNNPDNQNDTLKGQYVYRRDIQVIARATVVPPFGAPITAYVTEKVSIRGAPLFAHAIFYSNNDLEASPGPTLDIYGPVHVNGNMFPLAQGTVETGTANSVNFHGPVSITGDLYHAWGNQKPAAQGRGYNSSSGTLDGEPLGNDPITFVNSAGAQVNLKDATSGIWKDSTMGADLSLLTSLGRYTDTTTAAITQLQTKLSSSFRQYAAQTWSGNLQTSAMGVQSYNPVSFTQPIDATGTLPDPHAIIDPPDTTLSTSDTYYSAKSEVETQKLSNQTGLYVQVTVTPGTAGAADTAAITLYGAPGTWAASGSLDTSLKGPNGGIKLGTVPSGLVTFIPYSATATGSATTPATQTTYSVTGSSGSYKIKTTTKTGGTLTQAVTATYNGSTSSPNTSLGSGTFSGGSSGTSTGTTTYSSSAAATAALPSATTTTTGATTTTITTSSATVASGMYDQRQLAGINLVQVDMSSLRGALTNSNSNSNADGKAILTSSGAVWGAGTNGWNGGIYIEVKSSSGTYPGQTSVVVANGKVASGSSLLPTVNSVTGLALATNAPLYVAGNFNADGSNATTSTSATTPDDGKTNAAGTPTSAEVPVTLAADAITILSSDYFGTAGTSGSSVSVSNVSTTSAYKSYSTTSPSASGSVEIASAFITGIVATTNTSFSGGVHNLPRFVENWGSNAVAIRGSLVSLFKSNVATGSWAQRYYSAPKRIWGFDQIFQNGTFPPLTPKVMSYRRVDFNDLPYNTTVDKSGSGISGYATIRHTLWPSLY